jgi:sigma-E factor negative regulatory protein RseB
MRGAPVIGAVGLLGALLALPAHAAQDEARVWLERMTEALATRNYAGLFTHTTGRQSETMRIVHRVHDGGSTERLVSLDGSGREIVRTANEVHVYLPDRRVVLVEPRTDAGSLAKALPAPGPQLESSYQLSLGGGQRLLGRDVRVLDIRPRDGYRYGYRLWLDEKSGMPLRSMVVSTSGRAVEMIHFTQLEMPRRIDARETEASVDASGYQWVRSSRRAAAPVLAASDWRPRRAPPGFRVVASRTQTMPGVLMPVRHLVLSDGFASVSVFIEPGSGSAPSPPASASLGSASTFTTEVQGHLVTAVGEVPPETVRDIATSVAPAEPEPATAAPTP